MNLDLDVVPKDQLSAADYEAVIDLCSRAFEVDYAPFLETFEDAVHVLGFQDGMLVSHALWITRWLQIGDDPLLRTAYVEGVVTEERFRGKGYAAAVMKHLVEQIIDFDVAALSPADTNLYAHLGWEYWQGPLFHRKDGKLIPDSEDESAMILRLPKTPELNLSLSISIEWREGEVW